MRLSSLIAKYVRLLFSRAIAIAEGLWPEPAPADETRLFCLGPESAGPVLLATGATGSDEVILSALAPSGNPGAPPIFIYIGGEKKGLESRIAGGAESGVPLMFGPDACSADIAKELIALGAGFAIDSPQRLRTVCSRLIHDPADYRRRGKWAKEWLDYRTFPKIHTTD